MAVSAALVKELREKTGAGMLDCKNALAETGGDMDAAIDWLRKKGLAKAAKKAGRTAADGLIGQSISDDGKRGALVEVNAETDFVARNEKFQEMVREIAKLALDARGDIEALKAMTYPGTSGTVADAVTEAVAKIGENMTLRRAAFTEVSGDGAVSAYMHNAVAPGLGKIGVLVALESGADTSKVEEFGKKVAMHVAAVSPLALDVADLDQDLVERERAVLTEQAEASGKPQQVIENMVKGRLNKFYQEQVLLKQTFVVDPDITVEKAVENFAGETGTAAQILAFQRLQLGEGIEVEETDFAAEVAATAQG
jgi:elongation factor Ts